MYVSGSNTGSSEIKSYVSQLLLWSGQLHPRPAHQQRRRSSPSPNTQMTILWVLRTPATSIRLSALPRLLIKSILTINSWSNCPPAVMAASHGSLLSPQPRRSAAAAAAACRSLSLAPWKLYSCLMCDRGSNISRYNISLPESLSIEEIKASY